MDLGQINDSTKKRELDINDVPKHALYKKYIKIWNKIDKVVEGQEEVHSAGTEFLPQLLDQSNDEYENYKKRALFYEATGRTLIALVGQLFVKQPEITNVNDSWFDSQVFTKTELSLQIKQVARQVLLKGFVGVLVDVDENGNVYFSIYHAEDILNYTINRDLVVSVLLQESRYRNGEMTNYLIHLYIKDGVYTQDFFYYNEDTKSYILDRTVEPTKGGVKLSHIPFVLISPHGVNTYPVRGPLVPVMNVNISHYMTSADLEHGRHFTALPTAWVAGFPPVDGQSLRIGSQTAWVTNNPQAKAGFLEFSGEGLGSLERALSEKEKQMANLGGQFLVAASEKVQSGAAHLIKRSGENSALSDIADTLSSGMTRVLQFLSSWNGTGDNVKVSINKDYAAISADPQLINTLFGLVQAGKMSSQSLFYNLGRMGVVPENLTYDEEKSLIEENDEPMGYFSPDALDNFDDKLPRESE